MRGKEGRSPPAEPVPRQVLSDPRRARWLEKGLRTDGAHLLRSPGGHSRPAAVLGAAPHRHRVSSPSPPSPVSSQPLGDRGRRRSQEASRSVLQSMEPHDCQPDWMGRGWPRRLGLPVGAQQRTGLPVEVLQEEERAVNRAAWLAGWLARRREDRAPSFAKDAPHSLTHSQHQSPVQSMGFARPACALHSPSPSPPPALLPPPLFHLYLPSRLGTAAALEEGKASSAACAPLLLPHCAELLGTDLSAPSLYWLLLRRHQHRTEIGPASVTLLTSRLYCTVQLQILCLPTHYSQWGFLPG